jgi:hypothetical protein
MNKTTRHYFILFIAATLAALVLLLLGSTSAIFALFALMPIALYFYLKLAGTLSGDVEAMFKNEMAVLDEEAVKIFISPQLPENKQKRVARAICVFLSLKGKHSPVFLGEDEINADQYSQLKAIFKKAPELRNKLTGIGYVDQFSFSLIKTQFNHMSSLAMICSDKEFVLGSSSPCNYVIIYQHR